MVKPHCLKLFEHFMRAAASRTFCTAGSNSPMRMAMMAMTTSSSISVNAERERVTERDIRRLLNEGCKSGDGRKQPPERGRSRLDPGRPDGDRPARVRKMDRDR